MQGAWAGLVLVTQAQAFPERINPWITLAFSAAVVIGFAWAIVYGLHIRPVKEKAHKAAELGESNDADISATQTALSLLSADVSMMEKRIGANEEMARAHQTAIEAHTLSLRDHARAIEEGSRDRGRLEGQLERLAKQLERQSESNATTTTSLARIEEKLSMLGALVLVLQGTGRDMVEAIEHGFERLLDRSPRDGGRTHG